MSDFRHKTPPAPRAPITYCARFIPFSDGEVLLEDAVHDASDAEGRLDHVGREFVNWRGERWLKMA